MTAECSTKTPGKDTGSDHHEELATRIAAEFRNELDECRKEGRFPVDAYRAMGRAGLVGCLTSEEFGGTGEGVRAYAHVEELAAYLNLPAPQTSAQGQLWIRQFGTPSQTDEYLPRLASGELVFCEAISEPGAGSSLRDIRTSATPDGSGWLINGAKTHVNLGADAGLCLVYANTPQGLTAFLVPTDREGYRAVVTDPIGLRLIPTADVTFDNVRVTSEDMLGSEGQAQETFLAVFNVSRVGNASSLIGWGHRAMDQAIDYANQREVAGSVVSSFQGIRWIVAEAEMRLYAAGLARDRAATSCESESSPGIETSLAKLLAIEAADFATNESFALVGGHGLYADREWPQLLLDMKVMRTAGGSREVLRNYVAAKRLRHSQGQA